MGRGWSKADLKQLKALSRELERLSSVDMDRYFTKSVKNLAARVNNQAKKLTPVSYGVLRESWSVTWGHRADRYTAVVLNNLRYAWYVEYGHRQRPGRFIPGYWDGERFIYDKDAKGGMVLKQSWVNGRYMLTKATDRVERAMPGLLQKWLDKYLKEALDGK